MGGGGPSSNAAKEWDLIGFLDDDPSVVGTKGLRAGNVLGGRSTIFTAIPGPQSLYAAGKGVSPRRAIVEKLTNVGIG